MKRALPFLTAVVLIASFVLLAACSSNQTQGENQNQETKTAITLIDGLDREVTLDGPAQRVAGLAPSIVEILFAVGAGDQVVGREEFTNYPEEALEIPSMGGSFGELNTEAILAVEPDLVIVADLTSAEQVQALEELGLTVFVVANPTDLEDMYNSLRIVATLTGHEAEAEELIESLQVRVQAVVDVISNAADAPLVFYELDSTDPNAPWTSGPGTFIDTLITMAGGKNLGADFEGAWVQVSAEELIAQNPEIIVLGDSIWGVTPEDVAARPGWDGILAVQNDQVFPFNDDLASRPGPRLVDGLEALAKLIHPELFE
jgi:iron complex transport system substrate-binding protein